MVDVLALALESGSTIWHEASTLCGANFAAEVGLSARAEFAFATFCGIEGNDMVSLGVVSQ
jgi:hypothetical protein